MRPGDRVTVTAQWSSFFGMKGAVASVRPHLMILIDGDKHPIRVDREALAPEDLPTLPNMVAGED